jgi:RNA polymerase sigma-70 factor (ECF subfamily)
MDVTALPAENRIKLIDEAKNGSSYALAQLLQENYGAVYKYIFKLTLDAQNAVDITQDCMVRVIAKFALYDPQKSALSTWMIAIAKNLWIEECRVSRRRLKYLEQFETNDESEDSLQNERLNAFILKDVVLSALKKLTEKERIPVIMKHIGGYSYEEIAGILKIPLGTVKSRISCGMKSLKKELGSNE